ncbi:MAG: magnesium/cobalt transporter CorA [Pseudomonadota bacterium]
MTRFIKLSTHKKAGAAPGTLVHVGEKKMETTHISLLDYDADHLAERHIEDLDDLLPLKASPTTSWIDVVGIHDVKRIEWLGSLFDIHPLVQEDILNTGQRPKMENFDDYLFVCIKMLSFDPAAGHIASEQVSLVIGPHYLITFQEVAGDCFEPVRERIRKGKLRIRLGGPGYLAYAILDAVVDHYFTVLEQIGIEIEALEEAVLTDTSPETRETLHRMKNEMLLFRKLAWPVRELISRLTKEESDLIDEKTGVYFNDVHDHAIQVIDTIESYRDMLSGMMDLYLTTMSNRMNEVMKVLTIIATIFIPLTFMAGVYGMNFKYMPELEWPWAYFALWAAMIAVALAMVSFFRRKGWL